MLNSRLPLLLLLSCRAANPGKGEDTGTTDLTTPGTTTVDTGTGTADTTDTDTTDTDTTDTDTTADTDTTTETDTTETDTTDTTVTEDSPPPDTGPSGAPYLDVSAGGDAACALNTASEIVCWGSDDDGEVSDIPLGLFANVETGETSCALDAAGYATCWGWDHYSNPTTLVPTPGVAFTHLVVGAIFACGLDASGAMVCWGGNAVTLEGTYSALCEGGYLVCGLMTDGGIDCASDYNEVDGYADGVNAALVGVSGDYTAIACTEANVCATDTAGLVTCWGPEQGGEFPPDDLVVTQLIAGTKDYCALLPDQTISCWGGGHLANDAYNPVPPVTFSSISAWDEGGCGLQTDGALDCWGATPYYGTPPI